MSKQCKQLFLFCDYLVSSINGLRIVCLSRTAFLVVSFLGAGNSRIIYTFILLYDVLVMFLYFYYFIFANSDNGVI